MQKGSVQLFVLLTIILIVLGFGYIYIRSIPKEVLLKSPAGENINLKNYTNSPLGFQFQYSEKDLKVLEDSEKEFNSRGNGDFRKNFKGYVGFEPGKFLGAAVALDETNSYETNPFTVWIFENPDNLDIDNWYKKYWYYPFVWGDFTYKGKTELAPKNEATISGQLAKSGVIDYQPGKPKFIYLSKDKKMYLFRIIREKGDKIIASFKFLE